MCTTCATGLMEATNHSTDALTQKMVGAINGAALVLMTSIGHRTGLFDTMSQMKPASSGAIAHEAGLSERYVREWLGAMVTGGIVEYDPADKSYWLPREHAAILTRTATPNNLAVSAQWISLLGGVEDSVVEAFVHGRGVPYSTYRGFHRVMAEESGQTVVAALHEHILPLVPGLKERLDRGIDVLDIACGAGRAMIELANRYPNSRFFGYDFSEEAIELARTEARKRRVTNVTFVAKDLAEMSEIARFDLVTAFDAIHDQAKPSIVLRNIRRALRPGGVYLMQDIQASTPVQENMTNPLATFIYTVSCMHCMSVSLANGGPGLGAAWGKQLAQEMLKEAGFGDVAAQTLPHDPINYYYVAPISH